jgi:hypothetical protein
LRFEPDTFRWEFIGNSADEAEEENAFLFLLNDFLQEEWNGTDTELCNEIKKLDPSINLSPSTLGKNLHASIGLLKKDYGIIFDPDRNNKTRQIFLSRVEQ